MRNKPLVCLLAVSFVFASCDSNSSDSFENEAPALIDAEAFSMDTSLFGSPGKEQAGANFTAAALRVWPVSTIISANLILPALITSAAVQTDPTYDDGWVWETNITADGKDVGFRLTATPGPAGVDWNMTVSYSDGIVTIDDLLLYSAQSALNGKSGTWRLFYPIDGQTVNVLTADFEVTDADTKRIVFSVTGGPYENVGDSVEYSRDGDTRSFDWSQSSESKSHLITWDALTKAGSITATDYNDGAQACWNENFEDVGC